MRLKEIFCAVVLISLAIPARSAKNAYTEIAADIPTEGGGILSYSRMWEANRYFDYGFLAAGGFIRRTFTLSQAGVGDIDAETRATMFPFIGPAVSLNGRIFGISLAWGAYFAKTDFRVKAPGGDLRSSKSAIGTGFYSPLLVLDFYSRKYDLLFGFGLGGLLGTSYPTLVAENSSVRASSNGNPISTLTVHVRTRWYDGRSARLKNKNTVDEGL